ncbi:EexN family lipoprotein [Roseobacter sp. EG26]|uniref:EexN family lipoprotein n=1 Tax=Roseobacter sp. EG26 TaxID=3412477 RepID=UPI003CE4B814
MVRINSTLVLFLIAVSVAGCKDEEPNRTVDFYLKHADDRIEMLTKCEAMDGASLEANCVNAQKAKQIQAAETNNENRSDAVNSLFGSRE